MNNRTRTAVASHLGVPESTIRGWESRYGIEPSSSGGKRIYNDDITRVLETVKNLKDQHRTDDTIMRTIRGQSSLIASEPQQAAALREQSPQLDADAIRVAVVAAIQDNNDLAEKYAGATRVIGQLEERVMGYQLQLEKNQGQVVELQEKIKLLPAPDELATLRGELERTRAELDTERKKTWWQKLLGG